MLAVGILAAAGAAALVSLLLPPVYEANVSVLVRPSQPLATIDPSVASLTTDQVSRTYAELMVEPPLLQKVIDDEGLNTKPADLVKHITITPQVNTTIIDVSVDSTDPVQARDIANTLVRDFIAQIKSIQQQEAQAPNPRSADNLVVVSPAVTPDRPVSPNKTLDTLGGAAGGLLVAIGFVFLLDYLDQSVNSDEDLTERIGLISIGHVPFLPGKSGRRGELVALSAEGPTAEAYRAIRTNLLFAGIDRKIQTIVVTSGQPGEGKSRTAANLAAVLAEAGHRVALVDADFRRPSQHQIFGLMQNLGLANLLLQDHPEDELVRAVEGIPNLWLITSGPIPPNPSELLSSGHMKELLARLRASFTYLVIDTPPVNLVTDPVILAASADTTIIVVEQGKTTIPALQQTKQSLDRVGARIAGAVVNKLHVGTDGFGYYAYTYGESPGERSSGRRSPRVRKSASAGGGT